jgi:outer membrane biosynthesis protein TonB
MSAAILNRRGSLGTGWGGSLLLHAAVLTIGVIGWMRWQPPPAPAQAMAIEATVVTAPVRRRSPPPAPRLEPAPDLEPTPQTVDEPAAAPQVLATPVAKAEKPLPATKPNVATPNDERRLAEQRERETLDAKERERALRASLAAEERTNTLRNSEAAFAWRDAIAAHIMRNWRQPDSARAGLRCVVLVDQVPGGEVVSARIAECNGDDAVRQSIEAAVFRAAPLPQPPDAALFERRLELVFVPKD